MIGDVLAAFGLGRTVDGRAPIEVRRIHALAVVSISIESLEPVERPGDPPIVGPDEPLEAQRIEGPVYEPIGSGEGPAPFRHNGGHPRERLAVSQVGVEIEIGFAIVTQTHKPPWHPGLTLDLLVSRFAVNNPLALF